MNRLTKDDVKQMGMHELSLNQVFVENNEAWYRNFEMEMTARSFMRSICARNGINCSIDDNEFDEDMFYWLEDGYETLNGLIAILYRALWSFAEVRERLKTYEDTGLEPEEIGIKSGAALQKLFDAESNLTSTLKEWAKYKDLEEQGLLIKLPCKVNDEVYKLADYGNWLDIEHILIPVKCKVELICLGFDNKVYCDLVNIDEIYGINNEVYEEIPINEIFLTREEAEKASEE